MKLKLKRSQLKAIQGHALEDFPRECCGMLLGERGHDAIGVEEVLRADNLLGSSTAFEIDAELVYQAIVRAEASGLELVGIYHSHPNLPAFVSARDAEIMKLWPDVVWLILGATKEGVVERKAYVLRKGKCEELELEIE